MTKDINPYQRRQPVPPPNPFGRDARFQRTMQRRYEEGEIVAAVERAELARERDYRRSKVAAAADIADTGVAVATAIGEHRDEVIARHGDDLTSRETDAMTQRVQGVLIEIVVDEMRDLGGGR